VDGKQKSQPRFAEKCGGLEAPRAPDSFLSRDNIASKLKARPETWPVG
jgi:hypothetical protein